MGLDFGDQVERTSFKYKTIIVTIGLAHDLGFARAKYTPSDDHTLILKYLLLRHVGRPVSKQDLSSRALGRPHTRYDRSIDVHLSSIRRKLGNLADGRSIIQAVHRQGYQLLKE